MDKLACKRMWLGIYLIVMAIILSYLVLLFWLPTQKAEPEKPGATIQTDASKKAEPSKVPGVPKEGQPSKEGGASKSGAALTEAGGVNSEQTKLKWFDYLNPFNTNRRIDREIGLIVLVILVGALGSYVHAATSFTTFVGNRSLEESWIWWYVLRPFIGMALSLIFYFAVRGGMLVFSSSAGDQTAEKISTFGIVAVSGLCGMFSKQATDKLGELFDNLFRTEKGKGDEERKDKLQLARPVTDLMLEVNKITPYKMKIGETEKDVRVQQLYDLLRDIVTRIPILDEKGAVKYVIHQSMLYKFISAKSVESAKGGRPADIGTLTLEDLLGFPNMRQLVEKAIAFVPSKATLEDAKAEMEKVSNCQDVFVTPTGKADEPILGWLANTEISKHLKYTK